MGEVPLYEEEIAGIERTKDRKRAREKTGAELRKE
jgi:hypothetical protein